MKREALCKTALAAAVAAVCMAPAFAIGDEAEIIYSDIVLRKVIYDPLAKVNKTVVPIIPYADQAEGDSGLFIKNVSGNKTSHLAAAKAKMNESTIYVPAQNAAGDVLYVPDADGVCAVGEVVADIDAGLSTDTVDDAVCQVQPVVISYEESVECNPDGVAEPDFCDGPADIFLAVSLDDGLTYKRFNVSRTADLTSFTTKDGEVVYGDSRKAVQQVKGPNIALAWTDKFCKAGRPAYAQCEVDPVTGLPLEDEDGKCTDPVFDDFFGVAGSQGSIDYDADPETAALGLGEVPYSCVWTARAIVNRLGYLDPAGKPVIQIYKAERLTSGVRDALQIFMGAAGGGGKGGFALAWQEDPGGLRPGSAAGPGHGFSGATTNNKTDIWYSYIQNSKFAAIDTLDVPQGDGQDEPNEDGTPRVRALNYLSMPVRITDNAMCNSENAFEDDGVTPAGSRLYCTMNDNCVEYYSTVDGQDRPKDICVTGDGRLLNGDTGASRPNLFVQPYTDAAGEVAGAWAILAYEETKGLGEFVPDYCDGSGAADYPECAEFFALFEGKDVYYHSFEFNKPETVSAGLRVNGPHVDADGFSYWLDPDASLPHAPAISLSENLYPGDARFLTENARRIRFILQGTGMVPTDPAKGRTPLVAVWKQGMDGKGGPSDIMLTRMTAPPGSLPGDSSYNMKLNPYGAGNFVCTEYADEDPSVCLEGRVQNMSAQTPIEFDYETSGGVPKVIDWEYSCSYDKKTGEIKEPCNLLDESWENPYDNAIAHRGQIRSEFVIMGFSWTPNWAAARNGNDIYNFYVRRSFDGGQTWTTDPKDNGDKTQHCERVREIATEGAELVCYDIKKGQPEPPRNVSLLKNTKQNVAEPRIVSPPGTLKACESRGSPAPCSPEDVLDKKVVFVSYGLATAVDGNLGEDEEEEASVPTDMFYARTVDYGTTFEYRLQGLTTDPRDGTAVDLKDPETFWDWEPLAKDFGAAGLSVQEGEAQLRSSPDGNHFYGTWLGETEAE